MRGGVRHSRVVPHLVEVASVVALIEVTSFVRHFLLGFSYSTGLVLVGASDCIVPLQVDVVCESRALLLLIIDPGLRLPRVILSPDMPALLTLVAAFSPMDILRAPPEPPPLSWQPILFDGANVLSTCAASTFGVLWSPIFLSGRLLLLKLFLPFFSSWATA